jgi:predicted nucleotidyltransferase
MNILEFISPVEYHKTLNPKIWNNNHLKKSVRDVLIRIAEDFKNFVEIPFEVVDVVITGGNANYNYTPFSDIDLHLITNFDSIDCDRQVEELFDTKRLLYKKTYNVNIHGVPVELYVEDKNHPAVSGGSYSVIKGGWITEPSPNLPKYDESELKEMVKVWDTILKHAIKTGSLDDCRAAVKLLRKYRKLGLRTESAEFSIPNLVYKSLRNSGSLADITEYIDKLHDQELSL